MTDLREQLAQTIMGNRAVDNWGNPLPSDYELADAIIAALPGMVQPLVWGVDWRGRSISGEYMIWKFPLGFVLEHGTEGDAISQLKETLEAAKAAAQKHHVATIMQAFGVQGGEA